jgi:predicted neuraminidase
MAEEQDLALLPAQVLKPVPQKYADEQRIWQGIPSMTVAPNGRLWATWFTGGDGEGPSFQSWDNIVLLASSGDQGKTWTKPLLAIDIPNSRVRAYDPSMWTDPEGKVWLFWAQCFSQSGEIWDGRSGTWCIVTSNPGDENAAWSAPRRLCDGVMLCRPIADSKGRWLLPATVWNIEPDHPARTLSPGAHVVASGDKGKTWASIGHSTVPRKDALFDEHNIVEMKNGTFWMLHRTKYGIAESHSTDGGTTWTEPRPSLYQHPSARFCIRRLQSGNLLFVKHGAINEKTGRSHLQAFLSEDDGKSWKGGLMLDERANVSYPNSDQDENGTIYVIYDWERYKDKEILMARFTEEDVLAGKIVSPQGQLRLLFNKATGVNPKAKPE